MKFIYISILGSLMLFAASCKKDLDQLPANVATSESLTDFEGVLSAAYYYQLGSVTPLGVMGDFRADNAEMMEEPYPSFDRFNDDLVVMEDQFFEPFYIALYRSILSANTVIANSESDSDIGEAKFLRALSYFKLVKVFGDVTVNLDPQNLDLDLARQPAMSVYNNVIIPDLEDAISALDNSGLSSGRATQIAAESLLGKVYMQMGNPGSAEPFLANAVNGAAGANLEIEGDFSNIFGENTDLNSEVIFATQRSISVTDEYGFTGFTGWYIGNDSKSFEPLDSSLVDAFDAAGDVVRKANTIDPVLQIGTKYELENPEQDWIELRLSDIVLLYAEALNENGGSAEVALDLLDPIRERAGLAVLDHIVLNTPDLVRDAILNERRLELAFEGQRWFDLVRTGTVDAEMGESVSADYYLFPIPTSEILASDEVITQNPGY